MILFLDAWMFLLFFKFIFKTRQKINTFILKGLTVETCTVYLD